MLTSFKGTWTSCDGAEDGTKSNNDSGEIAPANIQEARNPSLRKEIGSASERFADFANENLIAARYGAMATIFLLTAYGVSNTPLFFRFRTVNEIPASYFIRRKTLYCRIINVTKVEDRHLRVQGDSDTYSRAIQVSVRHLSPIGQILPKTWFDFFMKMNPLTARLAREKSKERPEEVKTELLQVELAGVQLPPVSRQNYRPEEWLQQLARQRTLVKCQLLARKVPVYSLSPGPRHGRGKLLGESDFAREKSASKNDSSILEEKHVAVCRMAYRPTVLQLFATDIAEYLVRTGRANTAPLVLSENINHGGGNDSNNGSEDSGSGPINRIVDTSQRIHDLRQDVRYLDRLAKNELQAAKDSKGMWSITEVRAAKRDVVDEAEFQAKANLFQKLWRWLRG